MKKQVIIYMIILFISFSFKNSSYCFSGENNLNNSLCLNDINDKNINIEIKNIDTINEVINLDETYDTYSIITMDINNRGLDYIELSNINYSIYQGNKKLETFIESQNKYLGFVGKLESGESKEVKIGVVLEEKNTPLKLVFENLSDIKKEKTIKVINIEYIN